MHTPMLYISMSLINFTKLSQKLHYKLSLSIDSRLRLERTKALGKEGEHTHGILILLMPREI